MADEFHLIGPDMDIRFNAVLDYVTAAGVFHAAGYRRAAEYLLQRFIDDPDWMANDRDWLVLPILFLIRHYIELRLKEIIVYSQALSYLPREWPMGHDLVRLWKQAREMGQLGISEDQLQKVDVCVREITDLDPNSESFRYPLDKMRRPMFDHKVISLRLLNSGTLELRDLLDGTVEEMAVGLQNRPW